MCEDIIFDIPYEGGYEPTEYIAHLYTQCLTLFGSGYNTSVIIRQNNNRFSYEIWMKHPLTGTIKIIAISQPKKFH